MPLKKCFLGVLTLIFCLFSFNIPAVRAGEVVVPVMPAPGTRVSLSPGFRPAHITGLTLHPENALQFDFLIHKGDGDLTAAQKKEVYAKLVKYFLAALTVPDKDQWVNLSPYEKERIVEESFGKTEMGRDLLSQDYLLKQITSSLMYPESGLGKNFWDNVYARAYQEYGHTNVPVNTFNKVWIVPDQAVVYESGNTAYILKSHLKVMLEEDYLAIRRHSAPQENQITTTRQVIRDVILPELEREVNEGKNFAPLRQIVSSMVLATWYKKALKESVLNKIYADKDKTAGIVSLRGSKTPEAIYQAYLQAFKKGVYNYIKEENDTHTHQSIPRKYFAGGIQNTLDKALIVRKDLAAVTPSEAQEVLAMKPASLDRAQVVLDRVSEQREAAAQIYARSLFTHSGEIRVYKRLGKYKFTDGFTIRPGMKIQYQSGPARVRSIVEVVDDYLETFYRVIVKDGNGKEHHIYFQNERPPQIDRAQSAGDPLGISEKELLTQFSGVPGIDRIERRLKSAQTAGNRTGIFMELYNAWLLRGKGYKILAFDILIKESPYKDLLQIDVLVEKNEDFFFVEVKNFPSYVVLDRVKKTLVDKYNGKTKLDRYAEFFKLLRNNPYTNDQLLEQLGQEAAAALVDKFKDNAYRPGVVFVPSLQFEPKMDTDEYAARIQERLVRAASETKARSGVGISPFLELHINTAEMENPKVNTDVDRALVVQEAAAPGGIDLNSSNLDLLIKRDARLPEDASGGQDKGVPLPLARQDMAQLARLAGFRPVIVKIEPVQTLPLLNELRHK